MMTQRFWPAVGLAFVFSVLGAVFYHGVTPILGYGFTQKALVLIFGAIYLGLVLRNRKARMGRLVVLSVWGLMLTGLVVLNASVLTWLLSHLALLWLVRVLYCYPHLWQALADAALTGFSCIAALAALWHSHSVLLSLWSFFLIQAFVVLLDSAQTRESKDVAGNARFDRAANAAESALKRLSVGPQKSSVTNQL